MFITASLVISAAMGILALIGVESESRLHRLQKRKQADALGFAVL